MGQGGRIHPDVGIKSHRYRTLKHYKQCSNIKRETSLLWKTELRCVIFLNVALKQFCLIWWKLQEQSLTKAQDIAERPAPGLNKSLAPASPALNNTALVLLKQLLLFLRGNLRHSTVVYCTVVYCKFQHNFETARAVTYREHPVRKYVGLYELLEIWNTTAI